MSQLPAPAPSVEPEVVEVRGPSAVGVTPERFWALCRMLAVTDFRLRFFGSALGYAWQFMRPLLLFAVLFVVFTEVVRIGGDVPFYPAALLLGIVLFVFVSESTTGALTSLIDQENLIRKVQFPRLVIPASKVLTAAFNLGLNLVVVLIFLLVSGGSVRLSWLELPVIAALLVAFSFGLSTLLAGLYVRYRDVRPIWEVALQILFYASPVFYPIEAVPSATARHIIMLNPFAVMIQSARHALIDPSYPTAAEAAGGAARLLVPAVILVAVVAGGYLYFARAAPRVAEEL